MADNFSTAGTSSTSSTATGPTQQRLLVARHRSEISLSAFSFIFSELIQYSQGRVQSIRDLEARLEETGFGIGVRMLELCCLRDKNFKRETQLVSMLQYITSTFWLALFGKAADGLERSIEHDDEYMINEANPITNTFISVPPDISDFNSASFVAGIIAGAMNSSGFSCHVTAHTVADKTVFLVRVDRDVLQREQKYFGSSVSK